MSNILETGLQLCVPHTKPFYGPFIDSLWGCEKPHPIDWRRLPDCGVDDARNHLTQSFKDNPNKPRFMCFIDNDATWPRNILPRLMSYDLPIVCATMYTRTLPPTPTIGKYIGTQSDGTPIYRFKPALERILEVAAKNGLGMDVDNALELPYDDDTLDDIDGCGMHFVMIRRDVIERVPPPWFIMGSVTGAGEDFYFCRKAKDAGFPIYWDTGLHTGHLLGENHDYGLREMLAWGVYVDPDLKFADKMTEV